MKIFIGILVFLVIVAIIALCIWSTMWPSQPAQIKGTPGHVYPVQVVGPAPRPSAAKPGSEKPSTQPSELPGAGQPEEPVSHPVEPVEPVEPHVPIVGEQ